jgi:hypothetical protein
MEWNFVNRGKNTKIPFFYVIDEVWFGLFFAQARKKKVPSVWGSESWLLQSRKCTTTTKNKLIFWGF